MKTVTINGREYGFVVNLGTMTFSEMINKGIDPKSQPSRYNLGFALSCFHGADPNCDLTFNDIIDRFGKNSSSYKEMVELINSEMREYDDINMFGTADEENSQGNSKAAKKGR